MSIGWHTAEKGFLGRSIAGACATFSGIGLGRFGYVPLFPAMVLAGWIEASEAGLLGAANLAGYLAGALGGRAAARQVGVSRALDLGMLATALSFAACAFDGGFLWLTAWRAIAGASGGVLMALAGPAVQETTEPNYRGLSGGIVITGVGSGIVIVSLLMPALVERGLAAAWLGLAALVVLAWAFAHPRWPQAAPPVQVPFSLPTEVRLLLTYAIAGAGMVPHMVYLGDFAIRPQLWILDCIGCLLFFWPRRDLRHADWRPQRGQAGGRHRAASLARSAGACALLRSPSVHGVAVYLIFPRRLFRDRHHGSDNRMDEGIDRTECRACLVASDGRFCARPGDGRTCLRIRFRPDPVAHRSLRHGSCAVHRGLRHSDGLAR